MNPKAVLLIQKLGLKPHPEGGFYRETYRAPLSVTSAVHQGMRPAFTSIYFMLPGQHFSAWHRVMSDESWFFHTGSDLEIFSLLPREEVTSSSLQVETIGPTTGNFELTVPAGRWFSARPVDRDSYSLVSCVVAPGFIFEDFELADRQMLIDEGYDKTPDWPFIESLLVGGSA
jgi:uncharacterized protein